MRRRRESIGLILVVAFVALVATGCLHAGLGIQVADDGSGRVDMTVSFDDVSLQGSPIGIDDLVKLAKSATKSIDGAEVSKVDSAGSEGIHLSIPFEDYRQVTQALTNGEYLGYQVHLFQSFVINKGDDGHWTMSATVEPATFPATIAQFPPDLNAAASRVDTGTELVFEVSLPGEVLHSNADVVDGGTATWKFKGGSGPQSFVMETEPTSLNPLQLLLIGVGGLLLVGFVLVLVTAATGGKSKKWTRRRRRRRPGPDPVQQWQPKQPAPGSVGGRDPSVLPTMAALERAAAQETLSPAIPPIAPPTPPIPPIIPVQPLHTGVPTQEATSYAVAPESSTASVPEAVLPPSVPALEPPRSVPESEPELPRLVPEPDPAPEPPPSVPEPQPLSYVVVLDPPLFVPAPGSPAQAPAPEPPPYVPDQEAPPTSAAPERSHWLVPSPHEDQESHWLDGPRTSDEDVPADPTHWRDPPPKTGHWVRHDEPGQFDL